MQEPEKKKNRQMYILAEVSEMMNFYRSVGCIYR